ncbi:MAG: branched-chain amino acid ABC transporter permease [Thermoleophilia bacterium]|nr:branched-chain amino acid ABC transporter permease [Thermoleophilia bacterium]
MTRKQNSLSRFIATPIIYVVILALPWILRGGLGANKGTYWTHIMILIAVMILAASSMRAIFRTGEMSLGTAGFMLVGGYAAALLTTKAGLSPWLTIFLGGLVAAAIAALVSYPFFRVKGIYFVICTLLLGFILLYLAGYMDWLTGGWQGFQFYGVNPKITIAGHTINFGTKTNIEYYYLMVVVVSICLFILYRMENSRVGLVWKSIREADELAKSVGVNVTAHKIFIFIVACFFTGLAGGLYAFHVHALSPTSTPANVFHFFTSVYCLLYMVVGGAESFYGPILGTTVFMILRELGRSVDEYWPLIAGSVLILIVFFMPRGLVALPQYIPAWYGKLRRVVRGKEVGTGVE